MSVKAGVWIDHQQAILVLVAGAKKEIKKFNSAIEKPVRTKSSHKYTPNDFVAEDRLQRKAESLHQSFYDEVITGLQGLDALLILGPGEAKGEFHKRLKSKKLRGLTVEVQAADKMTDRQLAAKVAQHFAATSEAKSAAPKKKAKKKSAKAVSKKPAKKSRK